MFGENYFEEINNITNVSRETFSKLNELGEMLLKWNKSINLISKNHSNADDIWRRHIIDSAQLLKYIPDDAKIITDFGSGAGFPGIVLAIIGGYEAHLVESDQRKCAFLTQVGAALKLNIKVHNERIENITPWESDVLTARALASLDELLKLTEKFLDKTKISVFLKGKNIIEEIEGASKNRNIEYKLHPSISDDSGNIIIITKIS